MNPHDWLVGLNRAAAGMLVSELANRRRETDEEWLLGLHFLGLARLLDETPDDVDLAHAYREVGIALQERRTGGWDAVTTAALARVSRGTPSREW